MKKKRIVLINPQYPFGKKRIFLGGPFVAIGARLDAVGHDVSLLDLNIDDMTDTKIVAKLEEADFIGVSLTGSSDIPGVRELVTVLHQRFSRALVLLGGQIVERLAPDQFVAIFGNDVVQIRDDGDLAKAIACSVDQLSSSDASYVPMWQSLGDNRLAVYLKNEAVLVVSQGCRFNCRFCAATKGVSEQFREIGVFEQDLNYLTEVARRKRIAELNFYLSSLDAFQNPQKFVRYLEVVARVAKRSGVNIRLRCLSRFDSFLRAVDSVPNLPDLLCRSGLWCIGFGADGADPAIWKSQGKGNKNSDMLRAITLCQQMRIRTELLMVIGFPEDTPATLAKAVSASLLAVVRWSDVVIRPYLAKVVVPGSHGWKEKHQADQFVGDPEKFYNLDFCAVGSLSTHPHHAHRWACNIAYLLICGILTPIGKCATYPLLPQGGGGIYGRIAKIVNRMIPFDK
ncbi:MAG: cobalamin-dependent protein [bacterium]|nr:cobalamin-dependent protein [bacterium]